MHVIRKAKSLSGAPARAPQGFTLIELMVVIAVVAIIVGIAVPAFRQMTLRGRLTAAANELVAAMQTARMEAIRRNRRVVLCPSTNGTACGGADWARLMVFVDGNLDGNAGATELVIRVADIARPGAGVVASSATNRMWFGSDGRVSVGAGDTARVSLVATGLPAADNGRLVEIAASRVSVCETAGVSTTCVR